MKRDFSTIITTIDGKTIEVEPAQVDAAGVVVKEAVPLTLRRVALDALGTTIDTDRKMGGEEKFRLYTVGVKIVTATDKGELTDLTDEDVALLRGRIGAVWGIFVVGAAFTALTPDAKAE
jgi:hypothetical protein